MQLIPRFIPAVALVNPSSCNAGGRSTAVALATSSDGQHPWKSNAPALMASSPLARGLVELLASLNTGPAPTPSSVYVLESILRPFKLARATLRAYPELDPLRTFPPRHPRHTSTMHPDAALWALMLVRTAAEHAGKDATAQKVSALVREGMEVCTSLPHAALEDIVTVRVHDRQNMVVKLHHQFILPYHSHG